MAFFASRVQPAYFHGLSKMPSRSPRIEDEARFACSCISNSFGIGYCRNRKSRLWNVALEMAGTAGASRP
ncbi:hypothetical protein KC335_g15 [Hortaea werneckii]|nr:hypothetical protein KC335_g15 [Hortaea werneckii]